MKFLFFDCETLGLPANYKASYEDVNNWPRVIELAWILTDESGSVLDRSTSLIKPDGWEISADSFAASNGFKQEVNEADGVPLAYALENFLNAKMQADHLVAHNISFDHHVVWCEFIRAGMTPRSGMNKICTMMRGTQTTKIPGTRGFKWPKLTELYAHFFGRELEGAHGATADVTACMECFFKLSEVGAIKELLPSSPVLTSSEPNPDAF